MTEPTPHQILAEIQYKLIATKNKRNDFGGYTYRNKEGILEAVKPLLHEYGVSIRFEDEPNSVNDWHYIRSSAILTFPNGQTITATASAREAATKKGMDEAQITGAAISYAGKYALCNLFAIDDSADDPDATNDHGKRLPSPAELTRICAAETVEELKDTFRALTAAGCAKGYIADLCAYRKAQLLDTHPSPSDLFPEEPGPEKAPAPAYHD